MNGIALHPRIRNNVRPVLFAALRTAMRVFSKLLPRHIEDWALQRFLTPTRHTHRQAEMQLLERGEYFEVLRHCSEITCAFGRQIWDAMLGAERAVWPLHISASKRRSAPEGGEPNVQVISERCLRTNQHKRTG